MNPPLDVNGNLLKVGDFVVYGAGDRNSALQFGIIEKIDEEYGTRYNGTPYINYFIWTTKTDSQRNQLYSQRWDDVLGYVDTDKPQKSGKLNHYESRFMIMP